LDQVTMGMWLVAGSAAYLFGLSELGLLRFSPPSYEGPMPRGLDRQGDYVRAFGLGLLLGNAGIGCPNPAFYVLLTYLAGSGSVITGLAMGGIHGIGRATPLLAVAALAILGVNATGWLVSRREAVQRGTGWALVALGALLVGKPLFGHAWWEESVFHKVWNGAVHWALGANVAESAEAEALLGATLVTDPWALYGPWVFLGFVIALPILWDYARRLRELPAGGDHARQPIS
ncbi:MAG: cytochrome c biogenesis protein CcdA, partial [Candidatus Methylomirabilales bacterium]